ncbi:Rab-like protein 3, variant 3 [Balamuthia mandrillaris]
MLHEHRRRQYFIELWDVGGAKKYAKARTIFFNAPNGLILVHDLTNRKSFENLSGWIKQVIGADSFRWKEIGDASGSANSEDAFQQQHTFSSTILSHTSSFSSLPFSPFSSLTSDKPQTRPFSEHKLELELFRGSLPVLIIGTKADLWATSKFTALKPLSSSEIVEGHSLYVVHVPCIHYSVATGIMTMFIPDLNRFLRTHSTRLLFLKVLKHMLSCMLFLI